MLLLTIILFNKYCIFIVFHFLDTLSDVIQSPMQQIDNLISKNHALHIYYTV